MTVSRKKLNWLLAKLGLLKWSSLYVIRPAMYSKMIIASNLKTYQFEMKVYGNLFNPDITKDNMNRNNR